MMLFKLIGKVFLQIAIIIFAMILFIFIPTYIIFCWPIYLFRYIISILGSKLFKIGKIMSCRSTLFGVDNLFTKPRCTLLVAWHLDGQMKIEELRKILSDRILKKNENGQTVHPEMLQHLHYWMGFIFWKNIKDFNIKDYTSVYDNPHKFESIDEVNLPIIMDELNQKPFEEKKGLWEFIIVENVKFKSTGSNEAKSILLLRIHHCLADGFSILNLVFTDIAGHAVLDKFSNKEPNNKDENFPKTPLWKTLIRNFIFIFQVCFETSSLAFEIFDRNEWRLSENQLSTKNNFAMVESLSLSKLKEIKNAHGVSLTSVIIAGLSGSIRRLMLKNRSKLPEAIHCITPLPSPNHSKKLRNEMTLGFIKMPISIQKPLTRLKAIEREWLKKKHSTIPISFGLFTPCIGGLFPCIVKLCYKSYFVTGLLSNFPGPTNEADIAGYKALDAFFCGGMQPGNIGLGFTALSYNGNIRILVGINDSIISSREALLEFAANVVEEINLLSSDYLDCV